MDQIVQKFNVGDKVSKLKGYAFDGTVVAIFTTLSDEWRVVVEMPTRSGYGILHIFNDNQLVIDSSEDVSKLKEDNNRMKIALTNIRKAIENGSEWEKMSAGSLHLIVVDALGDKLVVNPLELQDLVNEMRQYIIRHGILIGECVAWNKLKKLTNIEEV